MSETVIFPRAVGPDEIDKRAEGAEVIVDAIKQQVVEKIQAGEVVAIQSNPLFREIEGVQVLIGYFFKILFEQRPGLIPVVGVIDGTTLHTREG